MVESIQIESASVSDRGLSEKRLQNEDSFLEIPKCGIFAVADGVGGAQAGEVASQMAMEILGEAFTNASEVADAEDVMRLAFERANSAIHQMSNELQQLSTMATTVVALHLSGNIATIGHVGDSRLYRLDADGTLYRETDDHSMVAEEVRAGRMTEEQADNHPGKNIISRALGAEPTVSIDLKTMMVGPNTTFLICSDGVTRHIGDAEIGELLRAGGEPAETCGRIKDICFERGAEDNLTAVIVRLSSTGDSQQADAGEYGQAVTDVPSISEDEEPTVTSARSSYVSKFGDDLDDDELLELDTADLSISTGSSQEPDVFVVGEPEVDELEPAPAASDEFEGVEPHDIASPSVLTAETVNESDEFEGVEPHAIAFPSEPTTEPASEYEISYATPIENAALAPQKAEPAATVPSVKTSEFSMFGNTGDALPTGTAESSGTFRNIAASVGLLLLGAVFGLAAYHFLLVPQQQMDTSPITEMRTANIPLSAFEENRRGVDMDPAGYIAKFGNSPQDCEDHYLLGRAYLLTADYTKAKSSLTEASRQLGDADPANARTLAADIALALAVTSDTTIQGILRKELDASRYPSNTAVNTNTNAVR